MSETNTCKKCGVEKNALTDFKTKNVCKECAKAYDFARRKDPDFLDRERARSRLRGRTTERRVYMKEYTQRPHVKEKAKEYRQNNDKSEYYKQYRKTDKCKARVKARAQNADVRERAKSYLRDYRKRPEAKERELARAKTPEYKMYVKEYGQKREQKEHKREYRKRPEVSAHRKEYQQTPERKAYYKAYSQQFGGSHYRRAVKRGNHAERFRRIDIFKRDKFTCEYCKKKLSLTDCVLEHRVPISKGGSHTPENCTTSCSPCNLQKSSNLIEGIQITVFDSVKI